MQQFYILFTEPSVEKWNFSQKIGLRYMNGIAIDEELANEVVYTGILPTTWSALFNPIYDHHNRYQALLCEEQRLEKQKVEHRLIQNVIQWVYSNERTDFEYKIHLILASTFYIDDIRRSQLVKVLSDLLDVNQQNSMYLTMIAMSRGALKTKEEVDQCFNNQGQHAGLMICENSPIRRTESFMKLQPDFEDAWFTDTTKLKDYQNTMPEEKFKIHLLNKDELKLFEDRNQDFLSSFHSYSSDNYFAKSDFEDQEKWFRVSKSKSKFAAMITWRHTCVVKNPKISWIENHTKMKILPTNNLKRKVRRKKAKRKK